ncbi:lactococcin [Bacillus lacus]|uniref:Lactococcin n=1 Tax=Metabacillus lacus TaxID=1983721 RepID=A0A7X2IYH3_9BACI|nr:bacteriorhodopsin [Metabacillus lacus]MRX72121.1 lactococcin [Metabacillus lacus]
MSGVMHSELIQSLLWFYVVVMFLGCLTFALMSRNRKGLPRVEYFIAFLIPLWSGLAYMSIAFGQGIVEFNGQTIYFARYIDWVVTTPLLLVALALTGMTEKKQKDYLLIAGLIVADVIMILTGMIADFSPDATKLTWYLFGVAAFVVILGLIWGPLRQISSTQSPESYKFFLIVASYLTFLWVSYPIAWLLGPSGIGVYGSLGDNLAFVLLPIFSKVGFSLLDLNGLRMIKQKHMRQSTQPKQSPSI